MRKTKIRFKACMAQAFNMLEWCSYEMQDDNACFTVETDYSCLNQR